jgi:hypothetical protein
VLGASTHNPPAFTVHPVAEASPLLLPLGSRSGIIWATRRTPVEPRGGILSPGIRSCCRPPKSLPRRPRRSA